MKSRVPCRYDIEVSPAFFKSLFERKEEKYSYLAPPLEAALLSDVEKNPDNIANRLKGIEVGDSLVFRYDPSKLDNISYMGDAKGVCELERTVEDIKDTPGALGRRMMALYFKKS